MDLLMSPHGSFLPDFQALLLTTSSGCLISRVSYENLFTMVLLEKMYPSGFGWHSLVTPGVK